MTQEKERPACANTSGNGCPACASDSCDAMHPSGYATARGAINYLTPLQQAQTKLGEMFEFAHQTLDEREYAAMVEILIARAASEAARLAWRKEQAR